MKLRIPHAACIVACDGRKALFLRNEGDETYPNLKVEHVSEAPDATAAQDSDRPGRIQNAAAPSSAVEGTHWRTVAEQRFAQETGRTIEALHRAGPQRAFIIAAPPRTLAVLRDCLDDTLRASVLAEVDKDLTKHPVYEIERLLTGG